MFKVLILICAVATDRSACSTKTAVDVVRGPPAQTYAQCIQESQATIAQTTIRPEEGKQYMKIVCESARSS